MHETEKHYKIWRVLPNGERNEIGKQMTRRAATQWMRNCMNAKELSFGVRWEIEEINPAKNGDGLDSYRIPSKEEEKRIKARNRKREYISRKHYLEQLAEAKKTPKEKAFDELLKPATWELPEFNYMEMYFLIEAMEYTRRNHKEFSQAAKFEFMKNYGFVCDLHEKIRLAHKILNARRLAER